MLDDLPLSVQPEDVYAGPLPVLVGGPFLMTVQDHVVPLGDHSLERDMFAGILVRHELEIGDECLFALGNMRVVLNVLRTDVPLDACARVVLIEHQVIEGFYSLLVSLQALHCQLPLVDSRRWISLGGCDSTQRLYLNRQDFRGTLAPEDKVGFMKPAAILFDLDDTILTCEGGDYLRLWMNSVEEHIHLFDGLSADVLFEEIRRVADEFWSDPDRHRRGRLDIRVSRQEFVATAASNLNHGNDEAAIQLADHYHEKESHVVPFEGALETLEYFRQSSTKTALITNGSGDVQREKIDKYQLDQYFDAVLVEGEFGMGKPNPGVYAHLVQELGVSEQESWIVGDNLEWEVRVPQQLGFFAIWNDFRGKGLPADSDVVPDRIVNSIRELIDLA